MPYAMRHAPSGTLLAVVQRNGYKLAYYGLVLWEQRPEEAHMAEALAEAAIEPGDAAGRLSDWEAMELTEHEAKMANVKLRNDPRRVVYYRNGILAATDA
ncbi:hypothetical protein ACFPPD_02550 [Cohnella suwonensis]|uniref:Uncharacterized protein n=1 Tax=Cohnella suwonensis TaxID=696072 RepID=A0ABW0LNV1_9BACL